LLLDAAMTNKMNLALIGYGEVGHIFAREFLSGGKAIVAAYDILFDDPSEGRSRIDDARGAGVRPALSAADAAAGADVVISAVTAASAANVADEAITYLRPGQIFFDINSASPGTKKRAAEHVNASGALYVEGAVMAPVPGPDLKVPILAGGAAAEGASKILNELGMNITPVTREPGRASAMKLCRSIMIKGIEALIIDCASAAQLWDVENEVYASLGATFPSIDFRELAKTMAGRVRQHGIRRAAEMREAGMMLDDLGLDGSLSRAVADAQQRGAAPRRR
jgi:3-hydroxyisobutyrate dehydrogenase-like beta-hydroxyacid dehydrogenase